MNCQLEGCKRKSEPLFWVCSVLLFRTFPIEVLTRIISSFLYQVLLRLKSNTKQRMNDFQSNGTWAWRCLPKNISTTSNSISFSTLPDTDFWYTPEIHNDNGHFFFTPINSSFVSTVEVPVYINYYIDFDLSCYIVYLLSII